MGKKIPLTRPYIDEEVKKKVIDVLESGFLTEGEVTKKLEEEFKKYIGVSYAIATTSCTTGLEVALRALKIGPGDEVIVPDYTYPATADVVRIVGATVVIVDINKDTMLMEYKALESAITTRTKAIIPVSLFGNPLDYSILNEIKKKYGIYIIEDAACSIGAKYYDKKVGGLADISVFSLHPRKFITTGEGGMITTNNRELAEWMESYKHFGMSQTDSRESTIFKIIGTNYKLSNVLAAIGLEQMKKIDLLLEKRRELAENYNNLLKEEKRIKLPQVTEGGKHSYQSYCIFISERDMVMKKMRSEGIEVQIGTYSLHMHEAFNKGENIIIKFPLEGSIYAAKNCLTLPLYNELTKEEQEYIVENLRNFILT